MTWKKALDPAATVAMTLSISVYGDSDDTAKGGAAAKGGTRDINLSVWPPREGQGGGSWLIKMEEAFKRARSECKITWKNGVAPEGDAVKKVKGNASAAADVCMFADD